MSTETTHFRRIHSQELFQALTDAGIIKHGEWVRRVVIDAQVNHAVTVYVERYGDERLLAVATALDGVEISGVPAEDGTQPGELEVNEAGHPTGNLVRPDEH